MEMSEMDIQIALRKSIIDLSQRGLIHAAKWSSEQLNGLKNKTNSNGVEITSLHVPLNEQDIEDYDAYLYAKSCFDVKEYDRVAFILTNCKGKKAIFLKLYAKYLSGEKKKNDEAVDLEQKTHVKNTELSELEKTLSQMSQQGLCDGFLLYLFGVVLAQNDRKQEALEVLISSVNTYPCNWSAWLELLTCFTTYEALQGIIHRINPSFMRDFFIAQASLDFHQSEKVKDKFDNLLIPTFPKSCFPLYQKALSHYYTREINEADLLFQKLSQMDPFNLEMMETFSHVLYIKEDRSRLSYLAHNAVKIDKYRSETCYIIGNYYSLRSEHEKALRYFERALKLNPNNASTWILLGHEFFEIKNANAAIEAYRKAIDVNPRDYRAWYGLGQGYELLKMPFYTLYYYQKAVALRPYDPRLWGVLGKCYEELDRIPDAIKCFERAIDEEGKALIVLARLYRKLKDQHNAVYYYEQYTKLKDKTDSSELSEAYLFLGYYHQSIGDLSKAEHYLVHVLDRPGAENEEAKSRLREIRSVQTGETSYNSPKPLDKFSANVH